MGISADSKSANQGTGKRAEVFFFLTFSFHLFPLRDQNPYFSKKKRNKKGFKCFGSSFLFPTFLPCNYVCCCSYLFTSKMANTSHSPSSPLRPAPFHLSCFSFFLLQFTLSSCFTAIYKQILPTTRITFLFYLLFYT